MAVEYGKAKLWLPENENVTAEEPYFLLDATHRGDMYHIRAAMMKGDMNHSIYLYNCKADNKSAQQVRDYLTRSALSYGKHAIVVPWESKEGPPKTKGDPPVDGCFLDKEKVEKWKTGGKKDLSVCGEHLATKEIGKLDAFPKSMLDGMAILEEDTITALNEKFTKLCQDDKKWKKQLNADHSTLLLLFRDTGTASDTGVHPELDSGNDSLKTIDDIVKGLAAPQGTPAPRTVLCGNDKSIGNIPSIGHYWKEFEVPKEMQDKDNSRDAEAYFLKWAYEKGYYKMAVGFRSGALDLFTFMGIPTVSISLGEYVAEDRHRQLSKGPYKRVNVQYTHPRQASTGYIKQLYKKEEYPPAFFAAWWEGRNGPPSPYRQRTPTAAEKKKRATAPGDFKHLDKAVVGVGLRVAAERFLKWQTTAQQPQASVAAIPYEVTDTDARFWYPHDLTGDKLAKEREAREKADKEGLAERKKEEKELWQPDDQLKILTDKSGRDWMSVHNYVSPDAGDE